MTRRAWVVLLAFSVLWWSGAAATTIDDRVRQHVNAAAAGGLEASDFHHLVLAFSWRATLSDWKIAESSLDRLAGVSRVDPLMSDELRLLRSRIELDGGRDAAARELFRTMGGLAGWWFAGPHPLEELADFERLAVPPTAEAAWRPVPGTDPLGWVQLSGLAWPPERQMGYLATTVMSTEEQPIAVRIGAAQVARVWVNDREVLTTAQPLQQAEDQAAGGAWLREGRNTVTVAVASEGRSWWLRARLTSPDGTPLDGVTEVLELPSPVPAMDAEPPAVRDLESEIRKAVAANEPEATVALAAYLAARRPQPVGGGGVRAACRAARREAPGEARLLEWLDTTEPGLARELLADAVAAEPELAWARIELARWYGERRLFEEAQAALEGADVREPALQAIALQLDGELWGPLVLPSLAAVARHDPRCVSASLLLAEVAERSRRWDLLREAVGRLSALVPGLAPVVEIEERLAESCGDGDGLRALYERLVARDPNQPETRIRLARLRAADGEMDAARKVLEVGLERSPLDIDLMMELARLENVGGDRQRVLKLARTVLEIRPQERRAQRLLELLGEAAENLDWLRTEDELWRMADAAAAGEPAVAVLDHREIHFLPSNLTEERVQQAFLILSADQAGDLLQHTVPFVAESERLRVLRARILRRDGSEIAARIGDTPRLSEPEFSLYYDTRLRVFRFMELEDGDLLEIAYVLSETEEANETGPYKGALLRLGRSQPAALVELELVGPPDRMPAWELVQLEGAPERRTQADGTVRLRFVWRDLPAVPTAVPPAPSLLVTPYLVYSNHPEWGELADWYARHVAPRIRVSEEVSETARRLVEGHEDRRERIARLYHFVTTEIRYVGLEFGEHRFRPFSADWVLHHRIGDCKDKAALLVALCDAVGIPARMVMVRTADQGPVSNELAILEIFNHAIVYLPEDELWLDGTASGHALVPPPGVDQGAVVLVIDGLQSRPQISPAPGAGRSLARYALRLLDRGQVEVSVRSEDTGDAADGRRARFAGSREPRRFARWLQEQFPGVELTVDPISEIRPGRDPTVIELRGSLSRTALQSSGGVRTYPGTLGWSASAIPGGERRGPLTVAMQPDLEWTLEVELGRPPEELPTPVDLRTPYGALRLDFHAADTGYRVEGSLHVAAGLIAAAEVAGLRDFLVAVERSLDRRLESP